MTWLYRESIGVIVFCRCNRTAHQQMGLAARDQAAAPGHWAASSQSCRPRMLHGRQHTNAC
jgi:hypothetical protein